MERQRVNLRSLFDITEVVKKLWGTEEGVVCALREIYFPGQTSEKDNALSGPLKSQLLNIPELCCPVELPVIIEMFCTCSLQYNGC